MWQTTQLRQGVDLPTLKVQHILRFRFAGLLSLEQSKFGTFRTIKANVEKVEYKGSLWTPSRLSSQTICEWADNCSGESEGDGMDAPDVGTHAWACTTLTLKISSGDPWDKRVIRRSNTKRRVFIGWASFVPKTQESHGRRALGMIQ